MTERKRKNQGASRLWLFGGHAVAGALRNPRRSLIRLVLTAAAESRLDARGGVPLPASRDIRTAVEIARLLPDGVVHQGLAAEVEPLAPVALERVIEDSRPDSVVVVLDHLTDPRNVGAIMRSAAAFGARAVIATRDHAPPESGVLARAASGALDLLPLVRVVNLARALAELGDHGFWRIGLDGGAAQSLSKVAGLRPVALVLGSEGKGLRRLTRKSCDALAKLDISERVESLNVSNAAAVALYELTRPVSG